MGGDKIPYKKASLQQGRAHRGYQGRWGCHRRFSLALDVFSISQVCLSVSAQLALSLVSREMPGEKLMQGGCAIGYVN